MDEKLQFGLKPSSDSTGLYVDVPRAVQADAAGTPLSRLLESLATDRAVDLEEQGSGSLRVRVNGKVISRMRTPEQKARSARRGVRYLSGITVAAAKLGLSDPKLVVRMSDGVIPSTRRYGMQARLLWPDRTNDSLSVLAGQSMRRMAKDLRYQQNGKRYGSDPALYSEFISNIVIARVDRRRGLSLETDMVSPAGLSSSPQRYNPLQPFVEVDGNNLRGPEQQLICLAGLVAVAHAKDIAAA